jgi:biopolymer transport protein ExbD
MMDLGMKKHRREGLELQLTAMIDIFTLIVIFLIKATVFATSDMVLPDQMKLPKSMSKEQVESAPQVLIGKEDVQVSIVNGAIPLRDFKVARDEEASSVKTLRDALKAYVDKIPAETKAVGVLLNVMADKESPYADVFDVVRVFRESGFETLLFIAATDPEAAKAAAAAAPGTPAAGGNSAAGGR